MSIRFSSLLVVLFLGVAVLPGCRSLAGGTRVSYDEPVEPPAALEQRDEIRRLVRDIARERNDARRAEQVNELATRLATSTRLTPTTAPAHPPSDVREYVAAESARNAIDYQFAFLIRPPDVTQLLKKVPAEINASGVTHPEDWVVPVAELMQSQSTLVGYAADAADVFERRDGEFVHAEKAFTPERVEDLVAGKDYFHFVVRLAVVDMMTTMRLLTRVELLRPEIDESAARRLELLEEMAWVEAKYVHWSKLDPRVSADEKAALAAEMGDRLVTLAGAPEWSAQYYTILRVPNADPESQDKVLAQLIESDYGLIRKLGANVKRNVMTSRKPMVPSGKLDL